MKLQDFLAENKMRAATFAKLIGVSPSTVGRWLNSSRQKPDLDLMIKIEEVTNGWVTMRDFVSPHTDEA